MSAEKFVSERDTLTYFEPLKDEKALNRSSNVLQIVYNFFGAKRGESEDRKKLTNEKSGPQYPAARPNVLNLAAQRGKRKSSGMTHEPGSEVELRLRSFSSMLWDFPKIRRPSVQHDQAESNDDQSTNVSLIPSSAKLRQYWMPDEQCHECYECGEKFTTFRRKHHCRICGQIFCSRCCNQLISGKFMGHPGMLRSCTYCCKLVLTFAQGNAGKSATPSLGHTSTSPNIEGMMDDISRDVSSASESTVSFGNAGTVPGSMMGIMQSSSSTNVGHRRQETNLMDEQQPLMPSIIPATLLSPARDLRGWKRPNYIFDATPDVSMLPEPDPEVENELVQDSAQLHLLWRRISDEKEGLEFRDHRFRLRKYSSCITGQELVDWLLRKDVASTRAQACAIGQALFEGKWLKSIVDIGGVFQDGYVLFQSGHKPATAYGGNKIEIYPDHFANFSGEEADGDTVCTLAEQDPMWVQEIKCENDDDEGSGEFYEGPEMDLSQLDGQANFEESLIYSDDDKSLSEKSILSLSSFVEIDEDNDVIKYRKRSSMAGDSFYGTPGRATTSPQPNFDDSCLMSISADYLRNFLTWHGTLLSQPWIAPSSGWREGNLQSAFLSSRDKKAFQWLREVYLHHDLAFLKQLLHDNELDLSWAEVLVPLAKHAADTVSPNPDLNIDVSHYVQIKKLMDAPRSESQVINGVACTKNVVHKQMKTDILEASILLLAIPLEYQRVQLKLATLDPIVRQEREFYKHLVSRITARQPHVVLVQCTVSHIAQELLLKAGITLVINVKSSVMERVARATEADIVYSIDRLLQARLGHCSRFYIKHHLTAAAEPARMHQESEDKVKTLMYFDGCNPMYGCTVILRRKQKSESGITMAQELPKVQSVLRFLIQAMYHARLELSYLIDQQEFGQLLKKVGNRRARLSSSQTPKPSVSSEECNKVTGLTKGMDKFYPVRKAVAHHSPENNENDLPLTKCVGQSPNTTAVILTKTSDAIADITSSPLSKVSEQSQICFEEFIAASSNTLLSTSPLIRLTLPFLYSDTGLKSLLHRFLPNRLFWSRKFDERPTWNMNDTAAGITDQQPGLNRSRSSTMESLLQDKIWLSPPHQHTPTSVDHDESTMSADTVGSDQGSRDVLNEETSTPLPIRERATQRSSYYSQHFKRHQRDMSTSSADSVHGSSMAKLHSWEQKVMDQVFPVDAKDLQKGSLSPILQVETPEVSPLNIPYGVDSIGPLQEKTVKTTFTSSFHDFVQLPLVEPARSDKVKDLLASFRAHSGPSFPNRESKLPPPVLPSNLAVEILLPEGHRHPSFPYGVVESAVPLFCSSKKDCLDPSNHQHICALFSSYSPQSPNAPYACVLPWVVDIEFYRGNDITLGGFLERYCFRPSYHCPNSNCRRPMVEHVRSFVHGHMCLTIVLKELSKPFQQSTILTWNWNYTTQKSSEIKTMSHDAWSMSFAKYLELRLEGLSVPEFPLSCNVPNEKPNVLEQEVELLPFTSFQYFLYGDMVAAFKCYPVSINEVVFPSHILVQSEENPSYHTCQLDDGICEEPLAYSHHAETMRALSEKTYEVLDNILLCVNTTRSNRLAGSSDSVLEEIQAGRDRHFDDLLNVLSEERLHLREEIDAVQSLLQSTCLGTGTSENMGFEDSFEIGEDDRAWPKIVHPVDENTGRKLSSGMLKLKCDLCGMVETWNQKLEEVNERDRSSTWGMRISSTGSSPLLPRRTGEERCPEKVKQHDAANEPAKKSSIETLLEDESRPGCGVEHDKGEDKAPPARQTLKKQKMSFSLESKISSSSYKRMSRTGSSVRLLVTKLLPGNTLIPSIPMPFPADEHYLLEECATAEIVVRDSEPASIIAYALRSEKYRCATEDYDFINSEALGEELAMETTESKAFSSKDQNLPSSPASSRSASPASMLRSDVHSSNDVYSDHSKSASKNADVAKADSLPQVPSSSPHVEVQFSDHTTKFYCKVYFASMFEAFRAKVLKGGEAQYLDSMSRSIRWVARGGKSGSTFHKTRDDQFILKQMSYFELQSFLEFAPKYMDYILNSIENHETTAISKILGVYRISFQNSETNRSMKQDVLVIENLFYQRKIKQIFDLKGSVRNRHVKPDASPAAPSDNGCTADHNDIVLLDENLLKLMSENPLYVHEHTKHLLISAITRDTNFLSANLIMDYSLLAGVEEGNQIVIGIIDFIRTFTWDKKLEMVVKSYGMFGGRKQTSKTMPTVVSPELYKNRFCEAMDRYFLLVPDRWYGMHAY